MPDPKTEEIEKCLEHAEVRIMQTDFADASTAETLYQEATDLLIQAEGLMKGSGAWLMACLHARRKNGPMCTRWLDRAGKASMLPDLDTIRTHAHFANAIESKWFKDWLKQHG
jgi:hypothetical protein